MFMENHIILFKSANLTELVVLFLNDGMKPSFELYYTSPRKQLGVVSSSGTVLGMRGAPNIYAKELIVAHVIQTSPWVQLSEIYLS